MNTMECTTRPLSRLARAALAAALAIALAATALLASPGSALAENGSVAIADTATAFKPTYSAYRVFSADIAAGDVATHVAWPSDAMKAAVLTHLDTTGYAAWLTTKGYTQADAHDNAQNALEYVSERITSSTTALNWVDVPRATAGGTFANGLARALVAAGLGSESVAAGQTLTAPEGFYLIVSQTYADGQTGTAPVWIALGGDATQIAPKTGAVGIIKEVKAAEDAGYSLATDAFPGQELDYRITVSLPENLGAYGSFPLTVGDVMSGVALKDGDLSSVSVAAAGQDVTASLTSGEGGSIALTATGFEVSFDDLLSLPFTVANDHVVSIEYKAHVSPGAGSTGGTNRASVTYPKDPDTDTSQTDATPAGDTKTFSYCLRLTKVDKSNGSPLAGAKYKVMVSSHAGGSAYEGKYIQPDGTLSATPYEFETGADGVVTVGGLDAATYRVIESAAPAHYESQDSDAVITISPVFNSVQGTLSSLGATVTGGEAADVAGDEHTRVTSTDAATRVVDVLMADDRAISVPATGLEGAIALYVVAVLLACAGLVGVAVVRLRRRDANDE